MLVKKRSEGHLLTDIKIMRVTQNHAERYSGCFALASS